MNKNLLKAALLMTGAVVFVACDDDDNEQNVSGSTQPEEVRFIVTSGDADNDLAGGVGLRVFTDLTTQRQQQNVYFDAEGNAVKVPDTFTQVSYNRTSGVFTGYIYARGASAQGIGSLKAGLRSYLLDGNTLTEVGSPVYLSNFGNTGTFGSYSYAAQISNPYVTVVNAAGSGEEQAIDLPDFALNGTVPNITNIVDMGNNRVAMVLSYSNCDSAAVAITDYTLGVTSVQYDGRIATSLGAMRSVRYPMSGADDAGNVYVFSGNSDDPTKVGALRIKAGDTAFDPNYHFNIYDVADGYRFRKAFHISGDYFLLDFYLNQNQYGNMNASGKLAVVNMSSKTLTWVEGLPDPQTISMGWGDGYDGIYYLPIAAPTDMTVGSVEGEVTPTIYAIQAESGVATPFMTFGNKELLKAITIIK